MNVGFIGLGAMGLPMAKRVIGCGHKLYITFHRRREPAEELRAMGAGDPGNSRRGGQGCGRGHHNPAGRYRTEGSGFRSRQEFLAAHAKGKVLIEMTSGTALAMQEIEVSVGEVGGFVLDAPVSGGTPAAAQGTLTIMVGGDKHCSSAVGPLLQAMGTRIVHVGKVGQGKIVKIVNQMMAAIHLLTIGEAFALGIKSGADPAILYEVIKSSFGIFKMMDLRFQGS